MAGSSLPFAPSLEGAPGVVRGAFAKGAIAKVVSPAAHDEVDEEPDDATDAEETHVVSPSSAVDSNPVIERRKD